MAQKTEQKKPTRCRFDLVRKQFDTRTGKDLSVSTPMDESINEYKKYKDAWKADGYVVENYVEY